MNFHSRNQSIIARLESSAMLQATEPDDTLEGETVEYLIEEFEITTFGEGLSLGIWNLSFTAIATDDGWAHGPVTLENVDQGQSATVDMAAVRDDPAVAAGYSAIELAILDEVDRYLKAEWTRISSQCDSVIMERHQ